MALAFQVMQEHAFERAHDFSVARDVGFDEEHAGDRPNSRTLGGDAGHKELEVDSVECLQLEVSVRCKAAIVRT